MNASNNYFFSLSLIWYFTIFFTPGLLCFPVVDIFLYLLVVLILVNLLVKNKIFINIVSTFLFLLIVSLKIKGAIPEMLMFPTFFKYLTSL
jgi:hypothetical protein